MTTNLVVIGQGYVGLPMALRAAEAGMTVVGLDSNPLVVSRLNSGYSHIGDISDEELANGLRSGFSASADPAVIADADVVVVCVPTPLAEEGGPDLAPVRSAAAAIGKHVTAGTLCILESTTYPGTTEEVFAPIVTSGGLELGKNVWIAFSPERIDPGNARYGVQNTPKVVGGLTPECTRRAKEFYSRFIDTVVETKGAKEAEMAKLLENTFRHVNIALVNEMVRFCDELDIDLWDAIDAAATKPFGFMAFRPGPGVGGHCIPVDPSYLSHRVKAQLGYAFRMVELAEEINLAAPDYVASRIWRLLNDAGTAAKGSNVLLVGVTYKPDVADLRETPAEPLVRRLRSWGVEVSIFDPYVTEWAPAGVPPMTSETNITAAARSADLVVLLQPHSSIDLAALAEASASVLDTRGVMFADPGHVNHL